jgi:uncharacterized membrane protein YiaA
MSSFQTYLLGFVVFLVGAAVGAHLLGAPTLWIAVGVIVLLGVGIMAATGRTKTRDPQTPSE